MTEPVDRDHRRHAFAERDGIGRGQGQELIIAPERMGRMRQHFPVGNRCIGIGNRQIAGNTVGRTGGT